MRKRITAALAALALVGAVAPAAQAATDDPPPPPSIERSSWG